MADPTTNFSWDLPDIGSSNWGVASRTLYQDIDTDVSAVKTTADAALPKAGGVLTGEVEHESSIYAQTDKGSVSGAQTLDLDNGDHFKATATGAVTWTVNNWAASGKVQYLMLKLTNGGAGTQTFPAAWTWDGNTAPTFQSAGVDTIVAYTDDNGTVVHATVANSHT